MSAGRVVVAAEVGGLREIVRSATTGWLCEPQPEALATVLLRCRADWEGSRAMAVRAAEEATRVFGLDAFGQRLRAVLDSRPPEQLPVSG